MHVLPRLSHHVVCGLRIFKFQVRFGVFNLMSFRFNLTVFTVGSCVRSDARLRGFHGVIVCGLRICSRTIIN